MNIDDMASQLGSMVTDQDEWSRVPKRAVRVRRLLSKALGESGISSGEFLEIGGRDDPMSDHIGKRFTYYNLDLDPEVSSPGTIVGDITNCPDIESGRFSVIASHDVFEHIDRPWLAASEIQRLLRPGGLVFVSTLFSWRYHPCPKDYWRYTPEALRVLFADFAEIFAVWDVHERRRDIRRMSNQSPVSIDSFGGWRENVRVAYAGVKRG